MAQPYFNAAFQIAMGIIEAGVRALQDLAEKGAMPPALDANRKRIQAARMALEELE